MRRRIGRRVGSVFVASLVFTNVIATNGANGANSSGEPDLVVTAGHVNKRTAWYFNRGEPATFSWGHRTKNEGRGQSPRSTTGFRFVSRSGEPFPGDSLAVPALSPGHAAAGLGKFRVQFDDTWEFGTYAMRICADVHHRVDERYETNNCKKLHRLYVVPSALTGTVTGSGPFAPELFSGVTMSWKTDVHFAEVFHADRAADGLFDYLPVEGSVTYKLAGTDSGGCTWSGSGTYNPRTWPAPLHLVYGRVPHYSARDIVKTDWAFTANVACPEHGTGHPSISPSLYGFTRWLDTGPNVRPLRDPGLVRLRGRYADQRAHETITIHWNLEAQ